MQLTNMPKVCVAMRSYNDIDLIRATLTSVLAQDYPNFELWNFDSSSTDGTIDVIRAHNCASRILLNDSKSYNPGKVLNQVMQVTDSDIVVFINSDATPTSERWLSNLVRPLIEDDNIAATFGRQSSRPNCRTLFVKDNERAFGDGSVAANWKHFFSMANSAIRRTAYERFSFSTAIQYSEDIDWSYRVKQAGYKIRYVADAQAIHSHNYTLRQSFKRHFGEGLADAYIYRSEKINSDFFRYALLPAMMEVLRDIHWSWRQSSMDGLLHSIPLRLVQKIGRWRGFNMGAKHYAK